MKMKLYLYTLVFSLVCLAGSPCGGWQTTDVESGALIQEGTNRTRSRTGVTSSPDPSVFRADLHNRSRRQLALVRNQNLRELQLQEAQQQLQESLSDLREIKDVNLRREAEGRLSIALKTLQETRLAMYDAKLREMERQLSMLREQIESRRQAADEIVQLTSKLIARQAEMGVLGGLDQIEELIDPAISFIPDLSDLLSEEVSMSITTSEGFAIPDVMDPPGPPEIFPAQPGVTKIRRGNRGRDGREAALTIFASEHELQDGHLTIKGLTNKQYSLDTTFEEGKEDVEVRLFPGQYNFSYHQADGKVEGQGQFDIKDNKTRVMDIQSGKFTTRLAEHRKIEITFEPGQPGLSGILWVRGLNSDYNERELEGKFPEELERTYLPGEYLFVFVSEGGKGVATQTFNVSEDGADTIKIMKKESDKGTPQ